MTAAGIQTVLPDGVAPNLAVALGGVGLDLRNLVALYASLAQRGKPRALTTRRDGTATPTKPKNRTLISPVAAHYVTKILLSAPPPPNARGGRIAFKTGTSYGHRDAWAVGYDGRYVVGVWVGRADATAVPGLLGRTAAAPVVFDAFQQIAPKRHPFPPKPLGAVATSGADLPPPLRRFDRHHQDRSKSRFDDPPVAFVFPPDRSEVATSEAGLMLRVKGGMLPLTWLVNGKPFAERKLQRHTVFHGASEGFVQFSVVDANGHVASSTVRIGQ